MLDEEEAVALSGQRDAAGLIVRPHGAAARTLAHVPQLERAPCGIKGVQRLGFVGGEQLVAKKERQRELIARRAAHGEAADAEADDGCWRLGGTHGGEHFGKHGMFAKRGFRVVDAVR